MSAADTIISTVWDEDVQTLIHRNMKEPTLTRVWISYTLALQQLFQKGMLNNLHFHNSEGWQQLLLVLLTAGSLELFAKACTLSASHSCSFLCIYPLINKPLYFLDISTPLSSYTVLYSNVCPFASPFFNLECFLSRFAWMLLCCPVCCMPAIREHNETKH